MPFGSVDVIMRKEYSIRCLRASILDCAPYSCSCFTDSVNSKLRWEDCGYQPFRLCFAQGYGCCCCNNETDGRDGWQGTWYDHREKMLQGNGINGVKVDRNIV